MDDDSKYSGWSSFRNTSRRSVAKTVRTSDVTRLREAVKKIAKKTSRRIHTLRKATLAIGMTSCIRNDVPMFNMIMTMPVAYGLPIAAVNALVISAIIKKKAVGDRVSGVRK